MKRRTFLKILGYTAAGAAVPFTAINADEIEKVVKEPTRETGGKIIVRVITDIQNFYFAVPYTTEYKDGRMIYKAVEGITMEVSEPMTVHKIEARIDLMGMDEMWANIPFTGSVNVVPDYSISIMFDNTNGFLTLS